MGGGLAGGAEDVERGAVIVRRVGPGSLLRGRLGVEWRRWIGGTGPWDGAVISEMDEHSVIHTEYGCKGVLVG